MTLSDRLLMVWKSVRLGFPFGHEMVDKVRFWSLESSRSIAMASLSVMILKSLFLYSLFTTKPCFTRKATPPPWPVERSFLIVS